MSQTSRQVSQGGSEGEGHQGRHASQAQGGEANQREQEASQVTIGEERMAQLQFGETSTVCERGDQLIDIDRATAYECRRCQ